MSFYKKIIDLTLDYDKIGVFKLTALMNDKKANIMPSPDQH